MAFDSNFTPELYNTLNHNPRSDGTSSEIRCVFVFEKKLLNFDK